MARHPSHADDGSCAFGLFTEGCAPELLQPPVNVRRRTHKAYLPPIDLGPGYLGVTVPPRLRSEGGELRLITTLTSFTTATDVSLTELQLEAFPPAGGR